MGPGYYGAGCRGGARGSEWPVSGGGGVAGGEGRRERPWGVVLFLGPLSPGRRRVQLQVNFRRGPIGRGQPLNATCILWR